MFNIHMSKTSFILKLFQVDNAHFFPPLIKIYDKCFAITIYFSEIKLDLFPFWRNVKIFYKQSKWRKNETFYTTRKRRFAIAIYFEWKATHEAAMIDVIYIFFYTTIYSFTINKQIKTLFWDKPPYESIHSLLFCVILWSEDVIAFISFSQNQIFYLDL